jgi:hypothetical protein
MYYFVRAVTSDTLAFYTVGARGFVGRKNSFTDTGRINLTAVTGPGENHSIIRKPDTRPDHVVVGAANSTEVDWTDCTFDGARKITLTEKASIAGGAMIKVGQIEADVADITAVSICINTLSEGEALFTNLGNINNILLCDIELIGEGHAFEIICEGFNTSNNTYIGFWEPAINGWKFDTSSGVNTTTNVITTNANHGHSTGDAVYYNKEGGSVSVGLLDGAKYYVNVKSATEFTMHATKAAATQNVNAISLISTGAEVHSVYNSKAVVYNNSGSDVSINVTPGSTIPSFRNEIGSSTIII